MFKLELICGESTFIIRSSPEFALEEVRNKLDLFKNVSGYEEKSLKEFIEICDKAIFSFENDDEIEIYNVDDEITDRNKIKDSIFEIIEILERGCYWNEYEVTSFYDIYSYYSNKNISTAYYIVVNYVCY